MPLPTFLSCYLVALRGMSFSACLCVPVDAQFPRRPDRARQYLLARCRETYMRVAHSSPTARNRQENLRRLLDKRRLFLERQHQISEPSACEASEANFLPATRKAGNPAWEYSSTPSKLSAILRKSAGFIGH